MHPNKNQQYMPAVEESNIQWQKSQPFYNDAAIAIYIHLFIPLACIGPKV